MNDTPPAIEQIFRRMLLKRSGEQRLKMGCSMHTMARAIAEAGLLQKHPGASPVEIRCLIIRHFYGADFKTEQRQRIAAGLSKSAQRSGVTRARARGTVEPVESNTHARVEERSVAYRPKRPRKRSK